jgi:hypothetical protein
VSADLLRRAATAMREKAEAIVPADVPWNEMVMAHSGTALDHALSWHPTVALAVADWLDSIAKTLEDDPSDYCSGAGHHLDGEPDECRSWWCWTVTHALAVASAYPGEAS